MKSRRIFKLRAGADATFGNRQASTSEVAANRARQRGNLTHLDCHAEGSQAVHAEQSATETLGFYVPPRRAATQFNLNSRLWRSFTKHPELNRDSFVFARALLHKIKQSQ